MKRQGSVLLFVILLVRSEANQKFENDECGFNVPRCGSNQGLVCDTASNACICPEAEPYWSYADLKCMKRKKNGAPCETGFRLGVFYDECDETSNFVCMCAGHATPSGCTESFKCGCSIKDSMRLSKKQTKCGKIGGASCDTNSDCAGERCRLIKGRQQCYDEPPEKVIYDDDYGDMGNLNSFRGGRRGEPISQDTNSDGGESRRAWAEFAASGASGSNAGSSGRASNVEIENVHEPETYIVNKAPTSAIAKKPGFDVEISDHHGQITPLDDSITRLKYGDHPVSGDRSDVAKPHRVIFTSNGGQNQLHVDSSTHGQELDKNTAGRLPGTAENVKLVQGMKISTKNPNDAGMKTRTGDDHKAVSGIKALNSRTNIAGSKTESMAHGTNRMNKDGDENGINGEDVWHDTKLKKGPARNEQKGNVTPDDRKPKASLSGTVETKLTIKHKGKADEQNEIFSDKDLPSYASKPRAKQINSGSDKSAFENMPRGENTYIDNEADGSEFSGPGNYARTYWDGESNPSIEQNSADAFGYRRRNMYRYNHRNGNTPRLGRPYGSRRRYNGDLVAGWVRRGGVRNRGRLFNENAPAENIDENNYGEYVTYDDDYALGPGSVTNGRSGMDGHRTAAGGIHEESDTAPKVNKPKDGIKVQASGQHASSTSGSSSSTPHGAGIGFSITVTGNKASEVSGELKAKIKPLSQSTRQTSNAGNTGKAITGSISLTNAGFVNPSSSVGTGNNMKYQAPTDQNAASKVSEVPTTGQIAGNKIATKKPEIPRITVTSEDRVLNIADSGHRLAHANSKTAQPDEENDNWDYYSNSDDFNTEESDWHDEHNKVEENSNLFVGKGRSMGRIVGVPFTQGNRENNRNENEPPVQSSGYNPENIGRPGWSANTRMHAQNNQRFLPGFGDSETGSYEDENDFDAPESGWHDAKADLINEENSGKFQPTQRNEEIVETNYPEYPVKPNVSTSTPRINASRLGFGRSIGKARVIITNSNSTENPVAKMNTTTENPIAKMITTAKAIPTVSQPLEKVTVKTIRKPERPRNPRPSGGHATGLETRAGSDGSDESSHNGNVDSEAATNETEPGQTRSHGLRALEYLSKLLVAVLAIVLLIVQSV